ncbi:hypothetical protein BC829DRAFT_33817 [Chytridium lagenaria]|nr:hypothetical protein BC829DRAFT_33817 [Chytridium lagenaria]
MKRDIGCYGKKDSTITVVDANVNVIESENDLISLNPSPALSKQNSRVIAFMNQILEETRKSDDHDTLVDELSIRDVKTSIDVTEIGRLSGKKMEESDGKKGVNGKKKISGVGYMNPTKSSAGKTVVLKKKGSGVLELPKMPVTVKFAKSKNSLESVTPCAEKTVKRCVKNAKSPKNPFEKVAPCAEKTAKNFLKNAKSSKTPLDAEKTAKKFVKNAALNIDSDAIELDRLDTVIAGYDFSRFKYDADSVLIDGHGKHVDGKDDNMKTSLSDANRFDLKDVPTDCVNDETVKTCLSDADRFNVKTDRPATINGERILNGYKTSLDSVYVKPSQLQWHDEKVKTFMSDASRLYTEDVMLSSGVAITFLRVIMSSVTCDDLMDEIPPFSVRCGIDQ